MSRREMVAVAPTALVAGAHASGSCFPASQGVLRIGILELPLPEPLQRPNAKVLVGR